MDVREKTAAADWADAGPMLENRTFNDIRTGDTARLVRTLKESDIAAFAAVSGDINPAHLDAEFARHSMFHGVVGHGMWTASMISTLLGTRLPGPGTVYLSQDLHFREPVRIGDVLTADVTVLEKHAKGHVVVLACRIFNQAGRVVVDGVARVMAPQEKVRLQAAHMPQIDVHDAQAAFVHLLDAIRGWPALSCAVVWPCDETSLRAAVEAGGLGIIRPVLLGPATEIRTVAQRHGIDLSGCHLDDVHTPQDAAVHAARLVAAGQAGLVMKGSLQTAELLRSLLQRLDLRGARRLSHVWRFDLPHLDGPVFVTDGVVNIHPDLRMKRDIVQNAIDCCHLQGIERPRVAILSALESVSPALISTIHAAALCKMAERGQISGGELDGPLALDLALSMQARQMKAVNSSLARRADILVAPDMEAGNLLGKQLEFMAGALCSGVVMGWRVPIALSSRSDALRNRVAGLAFSRRCAGHAHALLT